MTNRYRITFRVALVLASATLVLSCGTKTVRPTVEDPETTPTQISHDHILIQSDDGRKSFRVEAPLMERYELATEPFMEFREGIKVQTFDDSLDIESDLVANYAHYNETKKLWEVRGNVIGRNFKENRTIFTELLFWDEDREIIYTPERAKILDGASVHIGTGFTANQSFSKWEFSNTRGQVEVENPRDSTAKDSTAVGTAPPDSVAPAPLPSVPAPAEDSLRRP